MAEEEVEERSKLQKTIELFKLLMGTSRGRIAIFTLVGIIVSIVFVIIYLIISSLPEEVIIPEEVIGVGDKRPRLVLPTPDVRMKRLADSVLLNPPVAEGEEIEVKKEKCEDIETLIAFCLILLWQRGKRLR